MISCLSEKTMYFNTHKSLLNFYLFTVLHSKKTVINSVCQTIKKNKYIIKKFNLRFWITDLIYSSYIGFFMFG